MSLELVPPSPPVGGPEPVQAPLVGSGTGGNPDAGWIRLAGALSIATPPPPERALDEPALQTQVVVDLHDLASTSCPGGGGVVDDGRRARTAGRPLTLVTASPDVNRILALTRSSDEVEIAGPQPVDERDRGPGQPAGDDAAA